MRANLSNIVCARAVSRLQEHVQKAIPDRLPHPKPGLVKTAIFLCMVKLTIVNKHTTSSNITDWRSQQLSYRSDGTLWWHRQRFSKEICKQGRVVGTNFDFAADQQQDTRGGERRSPRLAYQPWNSNSTWEIW
eukprot:2353313-Amphidinium_carterae.2